jgi:signal transduction histidine kinase
VEKVEPSSVVSVREFWPRYFRRGILFVVGLQLLAAAAVAALLLNFSTLSEADMYFWIIIAVVFGVGCLINGLVFMMLSEPIKQLTAALSHTNGERSALTPPNPNLKQYAKSGLGNILQYIYELASSKTQQGTARKAPKGAANLEAALSDTSAGIVLCDENGQVLFANTAAPVRTATDGKKELELEFYTDTSIDEWLRDCDKRAVKAERVWNRIASKPVGQQDRKIYDISASYRKASATPLVLVFIERTNEYIQEDEDLNFIAFAAHELRGPITVIRGYLDTLNDELIDTITTEQQELFDRLTVSANRLSGYINNILNSSRYDRRHLQVHLAEVSISDIYATIADDMQLRASSQRRLLAVNLPGELPTVAADTASIGEVIGNLIDNAIKYSHEGGAIEMGAEVKTDHLEVFIQDHGIGIPANVVGNLFHKFYRSHRSRETVAGTGIGLYISKAIVESHGGEMEVKSVEGEGSRFMFTLPLYASVADKLVKTAGSNQSFIRDHTGSWIKNHGKFRG